MSSSKGKWIMLITGIAYVFIRKDFIGTIGCIYPLLISSIERLKDIIARTIIIFIVVFIPNYFNGIYIGTWVDFIDEITIISLVIFNRSHFSIHEIVLIITIHDDEGPECSNEYVLNIMEINACYGLIDWLWITFNCIKSIAIISFPHNEIITLA